MPDKKEAVVLIHGLWFSAFILAALARRLRRAGFEVRSYSYPSVRLGFRANAERLNRYLQGLDAATVHLVGHSLGGLLARALFHHFPDQRPGRIVTLGSPHQGSEAAAHLRRSAFWRYLMGRSVAELLDGVPQGWVRPAREIGSVSGTRSLGLARFVYRGLPRPNDGLLTVGESALPGAGQRALPVSHTGMLFSRRVADEVIAFLTRGRFGR